MKEIKTSWFLFGRQNAIPDSFSTKTNFRFCRFYYVLDGEAIYTDAQETITLEKGYVYLLPQKTYSLKYTQEKCFLHLWGHFQIDGWQFNNVMKFNPNGDAICIHFLNLIDALSLEYFTISNHENNSNMTNIFTDSRYFDIIADTFSAFVDHLLFRTKLIAEKKQPFDQVITYIDNNLANDLTNNALAKVVQYSRTHFIQEFTKRYHIPPQKYVAKARISHAIVLLMNNEKLYNISYKVGYDNPKSFARAFKRETGLSPKEYKNIHYDNIHPK